MQGNQRMGLPQPVCLWDEPCRTQAGRSRSSLLASTAAAALTKLHERDGAEAVQQAVHHHAQREVHQAEVGVQDGLQVGNKGQGWLG